METIYKYPFDEAQTQYVLDCLVYDQPWKLWKSRWTCDPPGFYPLSTHPKFRPESVVYKRTEPKDGNDL